MSIPKEVEEYVIHVWSTHWRLPDSPAELDKIDEDLEIFRNFRLKSYNWIRQWHLFFFQRWSWSISGGSTCSGRNIINLLNDGIKDTEQFSTYSPFYRYQKKEFQQSWWQVEQSLQSYNRCKELHTLVEDIYWLFRVPCQSNHQKTGKKQYIIGVSHGVSM